jgi:predicted phage baseplate assembly protein
MSTANPNCPGGSACDCGCCVGVGDRTPRAPLNRPGLDAVAYRTGTYTDFLASMVAGLTDADRAALARLTTRDPDDFSIGLLDAWAVASDVLTFYTERYAQESFLRTAADRTSLQELGRLIGYRLRPGVAAETPLAFSVEPPPAAPPRVAAEPGSLPPVVPPVVSVPVGLRVQSIPGPGEQPQTFETVEPVEARPAWGAIAASTTVEGIGATDAWLAGAGLNLKAGDLLLWVSGAQSEARFLTAVTPDAATGRTHVAWNGALSTFGVGTVPTPIVFRKQLSLFGANAPAWNAMSAQFRTAYLGSASDPGDWPNLAVNLATICCVHVDGSHPDVVDGSSMVIRVGDKLGVWEVGWNSEGSEAEFAVSGKVTHLIGQGSTDLGSHSRRDIVVHAASEQLALAQGDDPSTVTGDAIGVDLDVSDMPIGRRLLVTGRSTQGDSVVHATTLSGLESGAGRSWLILADAIDPELERGTVVVHANVANATHGETVGELLGSGRADRTHQRFTLHSEPLTHLQSSDPSGVTPALEVRVGDVRWDEVPTLYGAAPGERSYVLRTDDGGHTYAQFGDGGHGARLPTGTANVRARYRKGLGAAGNVGPARLANLLDRPLGLKGVSNPAAATGGTDPEPASAARASIPLTVRTLGRAVSTLDYEDYARAFAGVSKASAVVLLLRSGRTIVVTVAFGEQGDLPVGGRLDDLSTSLVEHGDPHAAVEVLDHVQVPFRLAMRVAVDPAREAPVVLAGVDVAIRSAFAFPARRFGAPVEQSQVIAVAHTVPGVVAVDLDLLYQGSSPSLGDRLVAPAAGVTSAGTASPAGVLVAFAEPNGASPFDWLEVMT